MRGKYIHGIYSARLRRHARFDTFPPHTSHVRSSLPQPHLHGSTSCGTLEPALGLPRLRHHDRAFGCHSKMLSRHSHVPRRRRGGGPCVVSWCAAQPPAAACLAAWRPGSLLQRVPRRLRSGQAPCCTGLSASTGARRRNRGRNGGWRGQAAAGAAPAAASRSSAPLGIAAAAGRLASEHPCPPRNIAA